MRKLLLYLSLSLLLFVFLQLTCSYDFLYAEQFRLFRFSADYAMPFLQHPGGIVGLLDAFTLQFFAYPYLGAAITALMFCLMATGTDLLLKGVAKDYPLPLFGIIISLMQVGLATETFYSLEQTWAQIICVWMLVPIAHIKRYRYLWIAPLTLLFYYTTGITVIPAIVMMLIIIAGEKEKRCVNICILVATLIVIAIMVHINTTRDISHTWTFDAYYHTFAKATRHSYFVPATMLIAVITASLLRSRTPSCRRKTIITLQIVVGIVLGGWYFMLCHGLQTSRVKKLEVWRWNSQWDRILNEDMPTDRIPLYANYQNLALAAKGLLADELMQRGQCGPTGLQQVWQGSQQESDLLSDIFMQQGHVAMAQKMAFTAMQSNRGLTHGRMLLRLIETNLILGADEVAEKYINILAQTLYYKDKAESYRKYIGHPEKVAADKHLGNLQHCTLGCDWCPNDLEEGLQAIIKANPEHKNALQYLGCYYILNNDIDGFKQFLDNYHAYPGLNPMPQSFKKAASAFSWNKKESEKKK